MLKTVSIWISGIRKAVAVGHALGYGVLLIGPVHEGGYIILFISAVIALIVEFGMEKQALRHLGATDLRDDVT